MFNCCNCWYPLVNSCSNRHNNHHERKKKYFRVIFSISMRQKRQMKSKVSLINLIFQITTVLNMNYISLRWRHNDHDGVSNHQPHGCLLNRLFRRRSKKTSKLRVTGLCVGNSPGPVNSPHKGPVTRKMFPFDDVIMLNAELKPNTYWSA